MYDGARVRPRLVRLEGRGGNLRGVLETVSIPLTPLFLPRKTAGDIRRIGKG